MQMLNRYFAPFALLMIVAAIYFSDPDPRKVKLAFGIITVSFFVNWWLSANTYRFIRWTRQMKMLQVWLNFAWAVPLVYLLMPYWGPMWLLFVMAPASAALYWRRWHSLATALVCAATLLLLYHHQGAFEAGPAEGAAPMACMHAVFIVVIALFIHGQAETAMRLRDANIG